MKGQKVKTLKAENLETGKHSTIWDGKDNSGRKVSSGVYFYSIKTNDQMMQKKMLLIK